MNLEEMKIIAECTKHKEENWERTGYRACVTVGTYFVKYGAKRELKPSLATQRYIFNYAQSMPDAPRIPKVIHHFIHEWSMYLVMEHIELEKYPPDLPVRIQMAVEWLWEVPAPPDQMLGPVGGGRIRHKFFKERL